MKKILGMMLLFFLVINGSVVLVGKWVNSGADTGTESFIRNAFQTRN